MRIISFQDKYKQGLLKFIDTIYKEFDDKLFLPGFDRDLLVINTLYIKNGGEFWLCIDESDNICGTIAFKIKDAMERVIEMKRFYIRKDLRGKGFADNLYKKVVDWCMENNYNKIILWSDKRFKRSHNFYLKRDYKIIEERVMNDGAVPYTEFCFECVLNFLS